ncbi:MAG: hypothetical protein GX496_11395 [Firmicutes bacterium]|nr:hypothetical protein [Bacillota bacterium]
MKASAAILAAVALGQLSWDEAADRLAIERVYRPDPAHRQRYDQLYRAFRRLYRATRKVYAGLNGRR